MDPRDSLVQSEGIWVLTLVEEEGYLTMVHEDHPNHRVLPVFKSKFDAEEFLNNWVADGLLEDVDYSIQGSEDPAFSLQLLWDVYEGGCTHVAINPPLDRRGFSLYFLKEFIESLSEVYSEREDME